MQPHLLGHDKLSERKYPPAFDFDPDGASLRAFWNGCKDFVVGDHRELSRDAIAKAYGDDVAQAHAFDVHLRADRPLVGSVVRKLRQDLKDLVAGQRAAGRADGDVAGGRDRRNRGSYVRVRNDGKACGSSIE